MALFGEAERGAFRTAHEIRDPLHLSQLLGEPPLHSRGLFLALQALLHRQTVLFFRVESEGFSVRDYLFGFQYLKDHVETLQALCLPGVGDRKLLDRALMVCKQHRSLLLTTGADLYDFLTSR